MDAFQAGGHAGDVQDGAISRRRFCQAAALGLGGLAIGEYLSGFQARAAGPGPLPPPIVTGRSLEICMNSRVSRHSGLTGTATTQQISNVLWAAGRAPVVGSHRTITLKTPQATYIYHPEDHTLEYSSSSTVSNAFRLNFDRELDFDAGVAYVLALWASVSLWTGTSSQLVSCPQIEDLNFGVNSCAGLTTSLAAVSSDGSLPNPITDGNNRLEEVLAKLRLRHTFRPDLDLAPQRLSQILWAGYGNAPHTAVGRGGLTVPSWTASYFLTNRIYVVNDRVWRYCNRIGSDPATRDHRLQLVKNSDVREQLRTALPDLPHAPCYVLLCLSSTGLTTWYQRLETGFVAGGILLQGAALGLGCDFKVPLDSSEQAAVKSIAQLPSGDYPHAIVAVGHPPADLDGDGDLDGADVSMLGVCLNGPEVAASPDCAGADRNGDGDVDLSDFAGIQPD
ncbi:MAG: nitroreductase family protein [Phycisphaerae bacterium]|jgi:hypothetical protein|nr:nitroreductase family protein [Phycisphaerae bacterium]HOO16179.1 hypothetical protein [Phycisphaerae bacterium]HPC21895.1 hypothetical protein [Phycisphaerae bacterium]HRS27718.1 hypothetical protein [Phycisphaerae bacterium]HRT41991.1 hypothetical protein [Phycisphaerae bacterium]